MNKQRKENKRLGESHQFQFVSPQVLLRRTSQQTSQHARLSIQQDGINDDNSEYQRSKRQNKYSWLDIENQSISMVNRNMFKSQRQNELLMMNNRILTRKIQEYQQQLFFYKNHTKKIEDYCKILYKKYNNSKINLNKAQRQIAYLQRKRINQNKYLKELCGQYEKQNQILYERMSNETRAISEISKILDNQSEIVQDNQEELNDPIPSPESYKLFNKLTNSCKNIQKAVCNLKRDIENSKLKLLNDCTPIQPPYQNHSQIQEQDEAQFELNYRRAIEQNLI